MENRGIEPRASSLLTKRSTNELNPLIEKVYNKLIMFVY